MSIEVRVPTLGESVTEATVATWFKKPGDAVAADEMLCELETDKVTVEVPAPSAGTLGEIVAAEGETVGVDALLATRSQRRGGRRARRHAGQALRRHRPPKAGGRQRRRHGARRWAKASPRRPSRPGSRSPAIRSRRTRCCANWKPTRSRSRCPAPASGTLSQILAEEGSPFTVQAGGKLAVIGGSAGRRRPPRRRLRPRPRRSQRSRQGCRQRALG
jgi:2-oxoglutarate dehydrogenase E2 component (dihydrolipoamide succinyltransferase)